MSKDDLITFSHLNNNMVVPLMIQAYADNGKSQNNPQLGRKGLRTAVVQVVTHGKVPHAKLEDIPRMIKKLKKESPPNGKISVAQRYPIVKKLHVLLLEVLEDRFQGIHQRLNEFRKIFFPPGNNQQKCPFFDCFKIFVGKNFSIQHSD